MSFVLQLVLPDWTVRWLFQPVAAFYEPWRFLTAAFLHSPGQYLHIVFNMVALWFVGPTLEKTLGRARYITLYLMSAVGGSVGSVLLATATDGWATTSVGASGAVFGLFGAILVVSKRLGGDVRGILVLIGINLALGFVMANIAWQAHVGGLVTGGLLAAAYAYAPPARRQLVAVVAPVALGAVLLVATLLTYASIGAFSCLTTPVTRVSSGRRAVQEASVGARRRAPLTIAWRAGFDDLGAVPTVTHTCGTTPV